jgi:hypothetical protein
MIKTNQYIFLSKKLAIPKSILKKIGRGLFLRYRPIVRFFKKRASNLRPKLDSEFKEKSVFSPFFLRFLTESGPNYGKKTDLRPRDQFGLDASVLRLSEEIDCFQDIFINFITFSSP